jgi:soluble lytic murein transglycosylase-like protein
MGKNPTILILSSLICTVTIIAFIAIFPAYDYSDKKSETYGDEPEDPYCFEQTSKQSGIPSALLQAISYVESNHNADAIHLNVNGSLDYGHMQINSIWISKLGETYLKLDDPCYCTKAGAWVLYGCIKRYGLNENAISCYNTGRALNNLSGQRRKDAERYVRKVKRQYVLIKSSLNR